MTPTDNAISPGWKQPTEPTRADRARIEGTIESLMESVRQYETAGKHGAADRCRTMAAEWRERLALISKRKQPKTQ